MSGAGCGGLRWERKFVGFGETYESVSWHSCLMRRGEETDRQKKKEAQIQIRERKSTNTFNNLTTLPMCLTGHLNYHHYDYYYNKVCMKFEAK